MRLKVIFSILVVMLALAGVSQAALLGGLPQMFVPKVVGGLTYNATSHQFSLNVIPPNVISILREN